jgi:hypothetical protein
MPYNITNAMQVKYNNRLDLVLQQQTNPLLMACEEQDDASAELVKVHDLVANREAQEGGERHGRTAWQDPGLDGVWIGKPNELYDAVLVDNADELGTSIGLKSAGVMGTAGVLNRARVRRILEGFYGPILSGKPTALAGGLVSTVFPGSQVVPVTEGGAAGAQKMNTKKLRLANKMLTQGYVPDEAQRFMVLTADDNDALLSEVPATSDDFKGAFGGTFVKGKIMSMLGWDFIHLELDNPLLKTIPDLATDGSGYRKNPFWAKGGLRVNHWQRLRSKIGEIAELQFAVGTLGGTTLAASRTQAGLCGQILNAKG